MRRFVVVGWSSMADWLLARNQDAGPLVVATFAQGRRRQLLHHQAFSFWPTEAYATCNLAQGSVRDDSGYAT